MRDLDNIIDREPKHYPGLEKLEQVLYGATVGSSSEQGEGS
jgi:hypothetical protein